MADQQQREPAQPRGQRSWARRIVLVGTGVLMGLFLVALGAGAAQASAQPTGTTKAAAPSGSTASPEVPKEVCSFKRNSMFWD